MLPLKVAALIPDGPGHAPPYLCVSDYFITETTMLTDDLYLKHHATGIRILRFENRQRAIDRLVEDGLSAVDAEDCVDRLMSEIKKENFKFGVQAAIVGGLVILAAIVVLILTDRLFYVILGAGAVALVIGVATILRPSPFRLRTQLSDE